MSYPENQPPPYPNQPEGTPPSYPPPAGNIPPPPSGPPPGYMPPPPAGPPPGYSAGPNYAPPGGPPPGYSAGPNYVPPGYTPPPSFGGGQAYQPQGGVPPANNMQAQLQAFVNNAIGVITKPSITSFDNIQAFANWNTVLITIGLAALTRGVFGVITDAIYRTAITSLTGTTIYSSFSPFASFFGGIFGALIQFFIAVGVWWLIARFLFKGTGAFLNYSHAIVLFYAPLIAATAVLSVIPFLGGLAAFAGGLYALYLAVLATASTHRLPMDRSVWTIVIPIIAGFVLFLLFAVLFAALLVTLGIHFLGR